MDYFISSSTHNACKTSYTQSQICVLSILYFTKKILKKFSVINYVQKLRTFCDLDRIFYEERREVLRFLRINVYELSSRILRLNSRVARSSFLSAKISIEYEQKFLFN